MIAWIKRQRWQLAALFLLALVTKLWFFSGHQNFSQDEVRDYLHVQQLLAAKVFYIPLGPAAASYSDFYLPPLYYYLQLLAQGLGGGFFYSMAVLVMVVESGAPLVLYFWLSRIFTKRRGWGLAFWLSLIYLCSPLVVQFSTSSWNPNLVPFFSLVFFASSWVFIFENRRWALSVLLVALAVLFNLHFQAFVLLPLLVVDLIFAVKRWRSSWQALLLALGLCSVLLSPYLFFEFTHGWSNVWSALRFITGDSAAIAVERLRWPVFLAFFFSGFYLRFFTGALYLPNWSYLYENLPLRPIQVIAAVVFWLVLLGIAAQIFCAWSKYKWGRGTWFLGAPALIFGSMVAALRLYKGDKPDYFLLVFLPFFLIFLGQLLNRVRMKFLAGGMILLLLAHEGWALLRIPQEQGMKNYQKIVSEINKVPKSQRVIVPLSQELITPLTYFFSVDELKRYPTAQAPVNILLCFAYQQCAAYNPTAVPGSERALAVNQFKYDLVTWKDYSLGLANYDATGSSTLTVGQLQLRIIRQQEDLLPASASATTTVASDEL
jgi:4-amino-4-deoxy-L-arabinose transferase-like glycosyltransferase